jgi:ATP-dependent helicase HrpB
MNILRGTETPECVQRRQATVKIKVLAPNQRPIQVTDDLSNFWSEQYPRINKELSRRYRLSRNDAFEKVPLMVK